MQYQYWRSNKGSIWKTNSNTTLPNTSKKYEIYTPNWNPKKNRFSYVLSSKVKCTFDHIISKGLTVSNTDYNWNFVTKENGYNDKNVELKPEDYKSYLTALPDHAILTANIEIKD